MSKRKPLDKAQIRERRDRMLEAAAAADLSLTEGVREMRAIAGMTQEEFARHRGVSARVIKALELGQGNPTVATLNRIGEFFGLEVAFVPIRRSLPATAQPESGTAMTEAPTTAIAPETGTPSVFFSYNQDDSIWFALVKERLREAVESALPKALSTPDIQRAFAEHLRSTLSKTEESPGARATGQVRPTKNGPNRKKKETPGSS